MYIVDFVVGGNVCSFGYESRKGCHICGKIIYFIDAWNWEKRLPICIACSKASADEDTEYKIKEKTIRNVMKITGMDRESVRILEKDFVRDMKEKVRIWKIKNK